MTAKERFLKEFPVAVADDAASVFVGAGVSAGAGYPTWRELLRDIGRELGVKSGDVADLAALAQWSISKDAGRNRILKVIKDEIGVSKPVPPSLETISRLPIRNIWTTNYDRLIERSFEAIGRPIEVVSSQGDLAIRSRPGAARVFKMHGTVDRLDDLVIATDDYELYRKTRGAFLPILQAHLTGFSMLFLGLSFTDPNVRHVLSVIRESFTDAPPEHFAIVRPPQRHEFASPEEHQARLTQHNLWSADLLRYGLRVVEIDDYDEVPELLGRIERAAVSGRVWVAGAAPPEMAASASASAFARQLGADLAAAGMSLVSGLGRTVGRASISGFLDGLQRAGAWDLERRLIVRPFGQPVGEKNPTDEQYTRLRLDLANASGAVVFIGGIKKMGDQLIKSPGVFEEYALAKAAGCYIVPVGAYGGAAEELAGLARRSDRQDKHGRVLRPSDEEIERLGEKSSTPEELSRLVLALLRGQKD